MISYSESPGYISTGDELVWRELFLDRSERMSWTLGHNACKTHDYDIVVVECEKGNVCFHLGVTSAVDDGVCASVHFELKQ